jgi:hypothetical protein
LKTLIAVTAATLAAAGLSACASSQVSPGSAARASNTASAFAYSLYTHCGIDDANIHGRWFEAESPLTDGSGTNPPTGWSNPYQQGTITMLSDTIAEFRDDHGHVVRFRLRVGATGPKKVCS